MYVTIIFALASLFFIESESDVTIKATKCFDLNALEVKCLNENTDEIPKGGTIQRHERLLVKVKIKEGTCQNFIPKFTVIFIPPATDVNTLKNTKLGKVYDTSNFEIEPFTIENTGKVILKVFFISNQGTEIANPETCEFNVENAKPEVSLPGGSEKDYPVDKETTIESKVKNKNNKEGGKKGLTFDWKCSVVSGTASNFCNDANMNKFKNKNKVVIPSNAAKKENSFSLTLKVESSDDPNDATTVSQMVYFTLRQAMSKLEVQCVKNCIPKSETTLPMMTTILKAVCINCGLTGDAYLFWTLKDSQGQESVDYGKLKNRKGDQLYLQAGALQANEKYTAKVKAIKADGQGLSAEFELYTKLPPPVKQCTIVPSSGEAFKTGFEIKCVFFPGNLVFEIFAVKDGKSSLVDKIETLEHKLFTLPAGVSVLLNVTDRRTGYTQSINLDVTVEECLKLGAKHADSEINKAVGSKLDQALDYAKDGSSEMALQGIAAVVGEYSDLPPEKQNLAKDLDKKAINTLKRIQLDTPKKAQQAVDILAKITERYDMSDPEMSAQTSDMCIKASNVLLNQAKSAKNPELIRTQVTNSMKALASCSQSGLKENKKSVESLQAVVNTSTTEYPLMPALNPQENYPDYADDEASADNMARFEKAATSMKNICFSNSKMLIYTMVPEEDPLVTIQGSLTIVAGRIYCHEIDKRRIETDRVSIYPGTGCLRKNVVIIDVLCCYTPKNPYWYIDNIPLLTSVVYTKFTGRDRQRSVVDVELLGEQDYFQITLLSNDNISMDLKTHESPLPGESISTMDEQAFYERISSYRIFVSKNSVFAVNFQNMTDADSYDITITHFEKPSFAFFKANRQLITANNSVVDVSQIRSYDSFWYLSVLPSQKMENPPGAGKRSYSFSVSTTGCYAWNETSRHWEFACHAKTTVFVSRNITCYCKYGHIFTGYIRDNKANLVENLNVEFTLRLHFCWIVFVASVATYFLFGVLLFFVSFEQPDDILDKVFFLGDVPSFYQYAYIVVIKTGNNKHAGTTSNITIKLCGSDGDSLEHVLNYPDPELVMVQRDTETWFVLATDKLLGDLKTIEIWFDSIGNNTKWYCSKIEIHDIQANRSWLFEIREWFDVTHQDHNKFVFKPTETRQVEGSNEKNSKRVIRLIKSFLGKMKNEVNLWNLFFPDALLSRKERASLIFSSVMLMYCVIMLTYSVPSFDESDTIDAYSFGFHYTLIWTPIMGSTVAFLVHFPFVYFIKRGKIHSLNGQRVHRIIKISTDVMTNICWATLVFISMTSMTALIICGFWIPMSTSLLWLISVVLGICFNILILQNISCIIYCYFIKLSIEVKSFEDTLKRIINYIELQRAWIYKRFGAFSLRPYFRHLYFNMDYITIRERFKWEKTKKQVKEILDDLVMISLYVTLLYIVLMLEREPQAIDNHGEVKRLVLGKVLGKKMSIKSISDIEHFTESVLLPSLQSVQWYGKFVQDNPGMTKDFSNTYLGIIRMRQHRTKQIKCNHPKEMEFLEMTCRLGFDVLKEFGSFSRGWAPSSDISSITTERMASAWRYSDSSITGSPPYFGEYSVYPGGGYVAPLGRNLKNSLINLNYLKKHKWLDILTRAVFIEFLSYNPNVNLFNGVTLIFEINAAGHVTKNVRIQTRKFLAMDQERIFTKNVISICFGLMILALIVRIVYKLVKKKLAYFYDLWSIFDIVIVLLSSLSIFLYYERLGRIYSYISDITKAKNNEFVNYFHLFAADNTLTTLTAMLVFVATLRLWKLLRFMKIVKITDKTLKDSSVHLMVCLVYQLVYMIAFSVVSILFFSAVSEDFRNFRTAFASLLLLGLGLFGDFDIDILNEHPFGIAFYIFYMMFSLFFTTVYVAIISLYYADAKDFYADELGFVQKYVQEKWTYYKTLLMIKRHKLRGGEDSVDDDLVIKPKSGDRYEDCFTIPRSKLDCMALVTISVLRSLEDHKTMTEQDFELMSNTITGLFGKESLEKELFFTTGNSRHINFVDDRKLRQIANICERLVRACKDIQGVSRQKSLIDERIKRINDLIDNIKTIHNILNKIQIHSN